MGLNSSIPLQWVDSSVADYAVIVFKTKSLIKGYSSIFCYFYENT